MAKELPFIGILSNKAEENPDFYNWNRVKLLYCDGASFTGDIIQTLKANEYEYTWGNVTVKLAESYGFCWGVERAIQITYEAKKQFPEEKIWITNEIIHNPTVSKVATCGAVIPVVYMRIFLPESPLATAVISEKETECLLKKGSSKTSHFSNTTTSFSDAICLLRSSSTFSRIAIIAFFGSLAEIGLHGPLLVIFVSLLPLRTY
ncbi:hypothetical protein POM88_028092 [Heracleum sosnowskyi]|uniref:Pectin acetylesterase n=1 Tax=Heracleum sosnowskyi TaxID=360622 RepID=A0AAD8MRL8_9APIA|nr:hypothetical protein POM88_028092 [Heracleum sosnowskyi]